MFCIKCGAQLPDEANFCDVCGNKVLRRSSHVATTNMDYDAVASKAEEVIINDDTLPLDIPYSNDIVQEKAEFIGESYSSAKIEYTTTLNAVRERTSSIERKYNQIEPYSEGLAAVERNGKWGFINKDGRLIIPMKYDNVNAFKDGFSIVNIGGNFESDAVEFGKWGVIDKKGVEVIPLIYDNIEGKISKQGILWAERDGKIGYIDINGEIVIPFKYEMYSPPSYDALCQGELAIVKLNGKWGFINIKGEEIIPLKYDNIDYCLDNIAKIVLNGKYGFVKYDGSEIIPPEYDEISDFKNNVAIIKQDTKFGYIAYDEQTKSLQIMIDCILEYAGDFETTTFGINVKTNVSEMVALILYDGEGLYINRSFDKLFESTTKSLGFMGELLIAIFCLLPGFMLLSLFGPNMDFTWWNTLILIISFAICRFIGWPLFVKREEGAYATSKSYYIKNRKIMKDEN